MLRAAAETIMEILYGTTLYDLEYIATNGLWTHFLVLYSIAIFCLFLRKNSLLRIYDFYIIAYIT